MPGWPQIVFGFISRLEAGVRRICSRPSAKPSHTAPAMQRLQPRAIQELRRQFLLRYAGKPCSSIQIEIRERATARG